MLNCKSCKHFIGFGNFGLCCDLKYGLCYADTAACKLFEAKEKAPAGRQPDASARTNNQL